MGKIAVLVPWLQRLFPPAELPGAQPLETSGDISYVHQVFAGNDDLGPAIESATVGSAGVSKITLVGATDDFYTIVHAAQGRHSDSGVGRLFTFMLERGSTDIALQEGTPTNTVGDIDIGLGRTILVPPGWSLGIQVLGIVGAFFITGSIVFTRVPIGHPHQHI